MIWCTECHHCAGRQFHGQSLPLKHEDYEKAKLYCNKFRIPCEEARRYYGVCGYEGRESE